MEFDGSMIVPKVPGEFDFELQLLELAEHPITPGKTFYKADTIHRFRVTVE